MRPFRKYLYFLIILVFSISSCNVIPITTPDNSNLENSVSLSINKLPVKLDYNLNEIIDLAGGQVILSSNGINKIIDMEESMLLEDNYFLHMGENQIRIAYRYLGQTYETSFKVNVNPPYYPVTSVDIFDYEGEIVVSDNIKSFSLYAQVYPETATNQKVGWSSSNLDVLEINQNGLISIIKKGESIVTLRSLDDTEISKDIKIIVASSTDLAAISSLIFLLDNYYANINKSNYTDVNIEKINEIYNLTVNTLNKTFDYRLANIIYLDAFKLLAEIPKISYNFNPLPYVPLEPLYAQYTILDNDLFITSSGLINADYIGTNTINNITVANSVADGSVTINNLQLLGTLFVLAGGEESVRLNNVVTNKIIVNKNFGQIVKLEINGGSVDTIESLTKAKLVVNTNVKKLIANTVDPVEILGIGTVIEILTKTDLNVLINTTITNLIIENADKVINIRVEGKITNLINDGPINIYGSGSIDNLLIHNSLESSLFIDKIIVPCDCPVNVNLVINELVNYILVLKSNTVITGTHSIGYVTINLANDGEVSLNNPETNFKVINGDVRINDFVYTGTGENSTDINGDYIYKHVTSVIGYTILDENKKIIYGNPYELAQDDQTINLSYGKIYFMNNLGENESLPANYQLKITDPPQNSIINLNIIDSYNLTYILTDLPNGYLNSNNVEISIEYEVKPLNQMAPIVYQILISGDDSETILFEGNKSLSYSYIIKDQFDQVMSGEEALFTLEQNYQGLSITSDGILTIFDNAIPGEYVIKASSITNQLVTDSYNITLTDEVLLPTTIELYGPDEAIVYLYSSSYVNFTFAIFDQYANSMASENVVWSIIDGGIEVIDGEVTIPYTTTVESIIVRIVSVSSNQLIAEKTLLLIQEQQLVTSILIGGPNSVKLKTNASVTADYIETVYDQYDVVISSASVTWSLVSPIAGIDVDSITGVVTLQNTVTANSFTIRATSVTNQLVYADKIVLIT